MITGLCLAIDDGPASREAEAFALRLAMGRTPPAFVDVVIAIDTPWLDRPQAVGIGGSAFKLGTEARLLAAAHAGADALSAAFSQSATRAGVRHAVHVTEGDPAASIMTRAAISDLIVMARGATFWGGEDDTVSPTVRGVLRQGARPVLMPPPQPAPGEAILVGFDGSIAAARSLHMLALLGLGIGRPVRVVSIATDQEVAGARAAAAVALLRAHGVVDAAPVAIRSTADPATIILQQAQAMGAGMLAIGAFGHAGLREFLFGSCTQTLLRDSPYALFVHH